MTILQAALLGLVQGLAEFLPVSSSGHLALARYLVPGAPPPSLTFDILLHFGTTAAVVLVFRRELAPLVRAVPALFAPHRWRARFAADADFRRLALLAVSALPIGAAGLLWHGDVERLETRPKIVAGLLAVTGLWLAVASYAQRRRADRPGREIGLREAVWIGVAQAVAILPGVSRSGATLGAGLLLGVRRESVGPFAFLMSIAPILAAVALKADDLGSADAAPAASVAAGVVVAFVSGVAALKLLLPFVRRGRLGAFAAYCFAVAAFALWRLNVPG